LTLYGKVKPLYLALPQGARRWILQRALHRAPRASHRIVSWLERRAAPDELYDERYYDDIDPFMLVSAPAISRSIRRELAPQSVIDVGCGAGALLASFEEAGVTCVGFDYAEAALERCRRSGLTVRRLDIQRDSIPPDRADVVVSTEVAEHLDRESADRFVELVTTLAPIAVVTAALPGQGGTDHVNEQPSEYWIEKFEARGFGFDGDLSTRLRAEWRGAGVEEFLCSSLMIFRTNDLDQASGAAFLVSL
jgi:SAM-dependent methyltransferase